MDDTLRTDAILVVDGDEVPVHARLAADTSRPLKTWHGAITAAGPGLAFRLVDARECVLRLPDGREGAIWPGGHDSEDGIAITGSGPAPWL